MAATKAAKLPKADNKANISPKNERLLHTKSGNRCAKCNTVLVEQSVCIGENTHI